MAAEKCDQPQAPHRDQEGDRTALLIIDMINCFDFENADAMRPHALAATEAIVALRAEMERHGLPVIYINDNFGEWHSERSKLVERAGASEPAITKLLEPRDDDFFIIKPQFSGFYATNLPVLLPKLGVTRLILTGLATDICVLFTAADAHMRDYALWIPRDAVAAETPERGRWALEIMSAAMGAVTASTQDLSVPDWIANLDR